MFADVPHLGLLGYSRPMDRFVVAIKHVSEAIEIGELHGYGIISG